MAITSVDSVPFTVDTVPAEVRVLLAQVLVEQRTAQLMAENVAMQKAALQSAPPADGTGTLVDISA